MSIFDLCCQPKAKKSLDYVLKWIDSASVTLNELSSSVLSLQRWQDEVEDNIVAKIDEEIEQYDWSKVIPSLDNYCEKVVPATQDYIAVLTTEGGIKMGSNKIRDLALANHTHPALGYSNLNDAMNYLKNSGVLFYPDMTLRIKFLNGEYTIDVTASDSGQILSALEQEATSGIFIPIKVGIEGESGTYLGYYYKWTIGSRRRIFVGELVFEYDTDSSQWLPAHTNVTASNVFPHWVKSERLDFLDNITYGSNGLTGLTNLSAYHIGLPVRLVPIGGNPVNPTVTPPFVSGIVIEKFLTSGPPRIYLSLSVDDIRTISDTYRAQYFDLYVLDNFGEILDFDTVPTQYSPHLITSGAVYSAVNALETRVAALEASAI